uniref:DNA excision repair protein ERCC-1 n=1 Tax=Hucho hucho TaxID=62062 RepID=A0A4W5L0V9_9TELE
MEKKRFNINLDDSAFTKERAPVKPLFQPSSKAGQSASSSSSTTSETPAQPAPPSAGQPLSYAEFIVQSKSNAPLPSRVPSAPQRVGLSRVTAGTGTGIDPETGSLKQGPGQGAQGGPDVMSSSSVGCERPQDQAQGTKDPGSGGPPGVTEGEEGQRAGTEQKQGEGQGSEGSNILGHPKQVGSGNSIIVSPRQRGNPILKFVRSVPWEFGEVVPDYVLGQTTCALFLSLRYHNLNPNYIHDRLKLLDLPNTPLSPKDPHHSLKELARICIMADCTLILAWSPEEVGRYLETYKSYEKKPADLLKEHVEKDYLSKVTDCLTTVKSVNKTDSITLLSTFSSLEGIITATKEDLVLCPGLGPQKARRLYDVLHQPFLKARKKDS